VPDEDCRAADPSQRTLHSSNVTRERVEAVLRFYALRLHEAGLIKSSPQKILAQGTDWQFLNELKKELKG
jgi:hypothetical protein